MTEYLNEILAAKSAKTVEVQLDCKIVKAIFFAKILQALKDHQISWSILTSPEAFSELKQLVDSFVKDNADVKSLNIVFDKSEQIADLLKEPMVGVRFVFAPNFTSDVPEVLKYFQNRSDLYLDFKPYDPQNPLALTAKEVRDLWTLFKERLSSDQVQQFPFFSADRPTGESLLESIPIHLEPLFSFDQKDQKSIDFSFIIPTYNSNYFLLNVIKHILLVSNRSYEIIVVDDGSSDETGNLLYSFLKDDNIRVSLKYFYWPKPNPRPDDFFRAGLCRNLGASHARGEYLVFLDSDILVPLHFLDDLSKRFEKYDVIQYVRRHIIPEKSNSHISFKDVSERDLYIEDHAYWSPFFETKEWSELPFFWKYTCTYCLAVRASHFSAHGGFHHAFISYGFEDTDLGYRFHKGGLKFHLAPIETLHLTRPTQNHQSKSYLDYKRHIALSKTAKIFFLLRLDEEIYKHFIIFMGGESTFPRLIYRIKNLFSKKNKRPENL